MLDIVPVLAYGLYGTGFFTRHRYVHYGMVRAVLIAFPAAYAGVMVYHGLAVLLESDCVLGAVDMAAAGDASAAQVGDFIIDLDA